MTYKKSDGFDMLDNIQKNAHIDNRTGTLGTKKAAATPKCVGIAAPSAYRRTVIFK